MSWYRVDKSKDGQWWYHASYPTLGDAHDAEEDLRRAGFKVRIEEE